VDGITMLDLAKIGTVFQVSIRVIDASRGLAVANFTQRVSREEEVLTALAGGARKVATQAAGALQRSLKGRDSPKVVAAVTGGGGVRSLAWVPAVGGVVFAGAGVALLIGAGANHTALTSPSAPQIDLATGERLRDEGTLMQTLGAVGLGVGGAALAAAGAMLIFGGPSANAPGVSVTPVGGGAVLMLGGQIP
jgi:hypothetical protein